MALSLRIIIEYPIIGNLFKENKFMNKKKKPTNEIKEDSKNIIRSKELFRLNEYSSDKIFNSINIKSNKKSNKLKIKRNYSFTKTTTLRVKRNSLIIDDDEEINIKERRKSSIDLVRKEERTINSNFFEYADYFTYNTLIDVLNSSFKLNDYMLRALLLLILETNNNVIISQEVKLKFVTKIKKFDDFKNKEYAPFLKLTYINREVKTQFINIIKYIEKYPKNLTHISYDIFLYLILNVCEKRKENKCAFNHLASSTKICGAIFLCALNHDKEAYNLIFKFFLELCGYILPYHKRPFLTEFLYELISSKNLILRSYGKVLINMMLVTNLSNAPMENI